MARHRLMPSVTFFVVIVLLSGVDVGLQLGWVDFVLHKLFPVAVVLDWIVDPAHGGYGQVAVTIVAVVIGFVVISAAMTALGNRRRTTG